VVFHQFMQAKVAAEIPEVQGKIRVISQSVRCLEQPFDLRGKLGLTGRDFVFLVPAGIRRVKNVTFCLGPLAELHRLHPEIKVVFAGPVIEKEEGRKLLGTIEGLPWAFYLGPVPHEQLFAILKAVDVVLNTSLSEGGMANAILEAMSLGVAVLASDIEGNRSVIEDGVNGFLFDSEEAFRKKAEALIVDEGLRTRLGQAAMAKVEREFTWEQEIQGYLALYRDLRP
jgi:glycosyltransferase involved in cell wall biosynthesis